MVVAPAYFLWLRLAGGFSVRDLKKVRAAYRKVLAEHPGPWLVCANHLTMIDSLLLTYGLESIGGHFIRFHHIPWNLPERTNFYTKNKLVALMCYLCKCIPVSRGGDRAEVKATLEKCDFLLGRGHSLMVFPEGGRSRSGRVDTEGFSYGVGRFVRDNPQCRIMCLYLRGDRQDTYSFYPTKGDCFTLMLETFAPERTTDGGVRAQRFYAEQIIQRLARMEEDYFAGHRERHSPSE
jgi:hypothetical protein